MREGLEAGGIQFAPRGLVAVSPNTSYVHGTDIRFPSTLQFTIEGAPVVTQNMKPQHSGPTVAGLAAVAKALNVDAVVVVRTSPCTAGVAQPKMETAGRGQVLGILPAISNIKKGVKAMRAGKYGANILDVAMFGRDRERIFVDHIIGRSKEDEGNSTVSFRLLHGVGEGKAIGLMKDAVDSSIATAFLHLSGKELAANTPGLGLESFARPSGEAGASQPVKAGPDVTGRYVLTAVNAKPLPAKKDDQSMFHSGTLMLNGDGTYTNDTVWSGVMKIFGREKPTGEKTNSVKGTYTVSGSTLALSPEGGALVRMTAPKNGEIAGDQVTLFPGAFLYAREGVAPPPASER